MAARVYTLLSVYVVVIVQLFVSVPEFCPPDALKKIIKQKMMAS